MGKNVLKFERESGKIESRPREVQKIPGRSRVTALKKLTIDTKRVKLYSVRQRKHKVRVTDFATVPILPKNINKWLESFPQILAAKDFRAVVDAIVSARKKNKPVLAMIGGHVVKCGVSPLLIDWMKRGILSAVAMNGSTSIHDFEVAYMGQTSEDVAMGLDDGTFGMVKETGELIHSAIAEFYKPFSRKVRKEDAKSAELGMGELMGMKLNRMKAPYRSYSILSYGAAHHIPVTVHTAIGTDTIYQHPDVNGAAMGETSLRDFYKLISVIAQLGNGGVVLNIGSAVILPEVFLKALTVARNLGYPVKNFVAVNFDMYQHYRPHENVVSRPVRTGGKGYSITGHHEIMIPLLYAAVMAKLKKVK